VVLLVTRDLTCRGKPRGGLTLDHDCQSAGRKEGNQHNQRQGEACTKADAAKAIGLSS
jgi:hypothetical protein